MTYTPAWLVSIPERWSLARGSAIAKPIKRDPLNEDGVVTAFRDGEVTLRSLRRTDGFTEALQETGYQGVRAGELVIHSMDGFAGAIGVSASDGKMSPVVHIYRTPADNPHYVAHALRVAASSGFIQSLGKGIRERSTSFDRATFKDMLLPRPPRREQDAIVEFLDRETARIDTLIEEQELLIELLRERRQALVETLTYGGVSSTAHRETREEWLPSVPKPWQVIQLGFVAETLAGWAFPSDGFSTSSDDTRLLRGVNVKPGSTDWTETVFWDAVGSPVPEDFSLHEGDLVFGMDRPFIGSGVRVASITSEDVPALLLQRVLRIRAGERLDPDYLRYVVMTRAFLSYLEPLFTGVSVPHASEWQVRKFVMPLPPLCEQKAICAQLDEQTTKIGQLIGEADLFIAFARERRAALITAAVTGQIDVLDTQPVAVG
ncbi:restriction endonuclease subunit S [Conexibacter sp. DBS9H8]|uniref:restriction endonuclease subunit S n=1 Tax=Conexibacter sp. DBS9H8 TaxID=2937801 RepID=UPI00200BE1C9|nr:restriction endonuclease subunit S [Conexibacter sp. DBS9H8]